MSDEKPAGSEHKPTGSPDVKLGTPRGASSRIAGQGPSFLFLGFVSIVSLVADIWSKGWAEKNLQWNPDLAVTKFFGFRYAQNKGGAWGLLQNQPENVRRPFFLLVSVAAIVFIVSLYRRLNRNQRALKWGLPLVLGGALGNVFDRIRYGYVVDFIDAHYFIKGEDKHWPTFNVADVAICVGVALMAIDMFFARRGPTVPTFALPIAAIETGDVVTVPATPTAETPPAPEAPPASSESAPPG